MKVVIDTNVFVSGVFWHGPPSAILELWQKGRFLLALSPEIVREYRFVSERLSFQFPNIDYQEFIDLVILHSEMRDPKPLPCPVSSDPKDDKFIACALDAEADYVVSGDSHLHSIKFYHGIQFLKPRKFLDGVLRKHIL